MVKAGRKPELIVIAGPNGSGKTSVTRKFLHHEWADGTIYINPDEVANDKFGDWNSDESVFKAATFCEEWREKCLQDKISFVFETVFSAEDKIDFLIRAKEVGFFIRVFFISTNHPSINASRIAKRVMEGGHDVPIKKIVSRYTKSIENCGTIACLVDRLYVYDNSINDQDPQLLFRLTNGIIAKRYVDEMPKWAQNIIPST
ncbi:MAG: zeta toxin family protein [Duncaniella sp.]|nr:zeta toxin family protein [Duncaniella sp.]